MAILDKQKSMICPLCGDETQGLSSAQELMDDLFTEFRMQNSMVDAAIVPNVANTEPNKINDNELQQTAAHAESKTVENDMPITNETPTDTRKRKLNDNDDEELPPAKRTKVSHVQCNANQAVSCVNDAAHNDGKYLCSSCNIIICADCALLQHKFHELTAISQMTSYYQKQLQGIMTHVSTNHQKMHDANKYIARCKREMQLV